MKKQKKTKTYEISNQAIEELAQKIVQRELDEKIQKKVDEAYEVVKSQIQIRQVVWVVTAESESGDDFGPYVFANKPTDKELEDLFRANCEHEFDDAPDGPGDWGSYLYVSISKATIIQ